MDSRRSSYEERGLKYLMNEISRDSWSRSSYEERGLKFAEESDRVI